MLRLLKKVRRKMVFTAGSLCGTQKMCCVALWKSRVFPSDREVSLVLETTTATS